MKKYIAYLLLFFPAVDSIAQKKKTAASFDGPSEAMPITAKTKEKNTFLCFHVPLAPIAGYAWQGKHTAIIGFNIVHIHKHQRQASVFYMNVPVSANFFVHNKTTYLYPDIRVVFNAFVPKRAGLHLSLSYWYIKISGANYNYLTPELGISKWNLQITYGYNFFLENRQDLVFSKHRIALRYYLRPLRKKFSVL